MAVEFGIEWCGMFISSVLANRLETLPKALQTQLELSSIPPLDRRRLGNASRASLSLLHSANIPSGCPIVFSSKEGEINRCFSLLETLAKENTISPTSFSLSVLNATPAIYAIKQGNHSEITALSARDFLEVGIYNAALKISGSSYALVIIFSEGVVKDYYAPPFYGVDGLGELPFWCFCLLLSRESRFRLSFNGSGEIVENNNLYNAIKLSNITETSANIAWQNNSWQWEYRAVE